MTWVQDGIYAAGGDSLPAHWADFTTQTGISAILHLRPGAPVRFEGPPPVFFLWLDIDDETNAGYAERLLAASFVQDCLSEGRRVLLHASAGRHRTRWCYVAYRILAGSAPEAAMRRAARPPWLAPYRTDEVAWGAFARQIRSGNPPSLRRRSHDLGPTWGLGPGPEEDLDLKNARTR